MTPTEKEAEAFHRDLAFFLGITDVDAPAAELKRDGVDLHQHLGIY